MGPATSNSPAKPVHMYPQALLDTSRLQQRPWQMVQIEQGLTMRMPGPRTCVLTCLGGVGKTKLVCMYMEKHCERYDYMFFLGADKAPKLAQGFAQMARDLELGDPESLSNPSSTRELVLEWLQTTGKASPTPPRGDHGGAAKTASPSLSAGNSLLTRAFSEMASCP